MPRQVWRLRFAESSVRDVREILRWTRKTFGTRQEELYRQLIKQAVATVSYGPYLNGSKAQDEIQPGLRTFAIAGSGKRGRHLLVYRILDENLIEVGRVLHDGMQLRNHLLRQDDESSADDPT